METFAPPRRLVDNPNFERDRQSVLENIDLESIDAPIRGIIKDFMTLPYCFTIQCCYGHFLCATQPQPDNLEPVPLTDAGPVTYRIAYIALCLENSEHGASARMALQDISTIDSEYVQFGSPTWFWNRYPNSYALQVEPIRFADRDQAIVEHAEALHIQQVRNRFFVRIAGLVHKLQTGCRQ
jgi:hypothetical protein